MKGKLSTTVAVTASPSLAEAIVTSRSPVPSASGGGSSFGSVSVSGNG